MCATHNLKTIDKHTLDFYVNIIPNLQAYAIKVLVRFKNGKSM